MMGRQEVGLSDRQVARLPGRQAVGSVLGGFYLLISGSRVTFAQ